MSHKTVHPTLLFALLMSASTLYPASPAFAQVDQRLYPLGGPGGSQYVGRCATGDLLNGFELSTGNDVDGIRAICVTARTPNSIGPRQLHSNRFGGNGAGSVRIVCPDDAPAIVRLEVGYQGETTEVVNNVRLYCGAAAPNQQPADYPTASFDGPTIVIDNIGVGSGPLHLKLRDQVCPAGLIAVGIHGRSGIWLDAVGLICGAIRLDTPPAPPPLPKPMTPDKPKLRGIPGSPQQQFRIELHWTRPNSDYGIEWYSIERWNGHRWITLPRRLLLEEVRAYASYDLTLDPPNIGPSTQNQAYRLCAENSLHRSCSAEGWYYGVAQGTERLALEGNRASVSPIRPAAAAPQVVNLPDLDALAAHGAEVAMKDPLSAELRTRTAEDALRGFDIGMAAAEGQTGHGAGKQRIRDALNAAEQQGFDSAVEFSLQRNRNRGLAAVGATIANADAGVAEARIAEDDVFYWLGFDIASGIFGDPASGARGNTATGAGSLGIRDALGPAAQRGFNASVALHLSRSYR
jgi:hypothetical protein